MERKKGWCIGCISWLKPGVCRKSWLGREVGCGMSRACAIVFGYRLGRSLKKPRDQFWHSKEEGKLGQGIGC